MMREPAFSLLRRPSPSSLKGKKVLVLGLGDTGLSVARWVEAHGGSVRAADTRASPPRREDFSGELHAGPFAASLLDGVDLVCISPGLSLEDEVVRRAVANDIPVVGDVELFAWANKAPVLAITGTNGKTTVTALVGHLLRSAGVDCEVAGNISPPVLHAAMKKAPAMWVLELSSYQLETTWSLAPRAATVLNVSEDHLDRYAGLDDYAAAKARVFQGGGVQVLNRDDPRSLGMAQPGRKVVTFGLDAPSGDDFGVVAGKLVRGRKEILPVDELPIRGMHNAANALAACALVDVPLQGLRSFKGLPHRLELVGVRAGKEWYDDSKGTNVGATVAALRGLGRRVVLILGGEGKGQDFAPLREPVRDFAVKTFLVGRDAPLIEKALAGLATQRVSSLEEAVQEASAVKADAVLLSPACASFDMFRDYQHRGEVFSAAVKALAA